MKKFLKNTYNYTVKLIETLISFLSILIFSRFTFSKNLKNVNKNHDYCYLITNGPSLKTVMEEEGEKNIFKREDIFTVNLFYEVPFFHEIKPKNHVIADNGFWDPAQDERMKGIQKRFKDYLLEVNWEMNLFVPYAGYSKIKKILESNKNIKLIPYNHTPVNGFKAIAHFLYKLNLGMPRPANVLNSAIFLALNLGYKKMYIYGADHSWMKDVFVDENNDICSYENHFYDNTKKPYKLPKGTLSSGLKGIVDAFESYKDLDDYSKSINSKIINKTKGSYIDVFDRE